jgi:hypothetical protein
VVNVQLLLFDIAYSQFSHSHLIYWQIIIVSSRSSFIQLTKRLILSQWSMIKKKAEVKSN